MTSPLPLVVEISEWQTKLLPGHVLSPADRRFLASAANNALNSLGIEELRDGLRISASSSVGVVRLETLEVRIAPKLAGDNLRLIEMIELTAGVDMLRRLPNVHAISTQGASLFDLIALMLVEETERLVRNGLLCDYVTEEDSLPVVRGRLLTDRQLLRRFGRLDRLECRFDERQHDITENRLLAAALTCCAQRVQHVVVRRKVRQVLADLLACCEPAIDLTAARNEIIYNRMNEHYRVAHKLAWLVLDGLGVDDPLNSSGTRCFCFLVDMNTLFERFVYKIVARLFGPPGFHTRYQAADRSIIVSHPSQRPYGRVTPDILVSPADQAQTRLAIDAKYKLYDTKRVGSSDIYQAFIYAYAFGGMPAKPPETLLIYPATQPIGQIDRLRIRTAGDLADAGINVLGLHIPTVLCEFRRGRCDSALSALRKAVTNALGTGAASSQAGA